MITNPGPGSKKTGNLHALTDDYIRDVFMQVPASIVMYKGPAFIVELINEKALEMWGASYTQVINKPLFDLAPELQQRLEHILTQVYTSGEPFIAREYAVAYKRNGELTEAFLNLVLHPVRDQNGIITGIASIGTDVTDEVHEKRKLEASRQEFARALEREVANRTEELEKKNYELKQQKLFSDTIINTSIDLISVYDKELRVLELNKACEDFLGIKKEVVTGKVFTEAFPGARDGQAHRDMLRALDGEMVHNKLYTSPITGRAYQNFLIPLKHDTGEVYGVLVIAHDITEIMESAEATRQSEEKFNRLFAASPLGLTLSEYDTGKILDVNEQHMKTTGYARKDYIGKTTLDLNLIAKDTRREVFEAVKKEGAVKNAELEIITRTGERLFVLNSIETIEIGKQKYYLSAIIDITDRKLAEYKIELANTELRQMNEELKAFTFVASHDLQEPLRKIQTLATWLKEEEKDKLTEKGNLYLNRMADAANRMQKLIKDLLSFSQISSSKSSLEPVDLALLAEEVRSEFAELLYQKKATFALPESLLINLVHFQFKQLLSNLLSNSLKFAKQNVPPHIVLKAQLLQRAALPGEISAAMGSGISKVCHIAYSDNGIGFEPKYATKIFEVFQRLHQQNEYSGTGIGLAIVKKVVDFHKGVITASSEPDAGARFDIYLPV